MKTLIATLVIVGFVGSTSIAQTPEDGMNKDSKAIVQQTAKTKITLDKVPEVVQKSFKDNEYSLADIDGIFEMTKNDEKVYEFIIKSDKEKWAIHFDAEGKLLKEQKVDA